MKIEDTCVIIGASHAGVNAAFALRREGWLGSITIIDKDPKTPYHRPPLSKSFLTTDHGVADHLLMSEESYKKERIRLKLGMSVTKIDKKEKLVILNDGSTEYYDKLILATGARPLIPRIVGLDSSKQIFYMRTAEDAIRIRAACHLSKLKRVVIIGGGYIGLESAASLRKLGSIVTVLERDSRLLSRVTAPVMSDFFFKLHTDKGVTIELNKNVTIVKSEDNCMKVDCDDGFEYDADVIIVGVGVSVNSSLAEGAGLKVEDGISVDQKTQSSEEHIYAIGDCTYHYNCHYNKFIRLESVQNAVDQAKTAAKNICGKNALYDTIPWFWSDQYDIKLQMVGLSTTYTEVVLRKEISDSVSFSVWYFKGSELLAVDAVNSPKAYVLGTKFIKGRKNINKSLLENSEIPLHPSTLIIVDSI